MAKQVRKGSKVEWKWGKNTAAGKVEDKKASRVTIRSKGKEISKNGTEDNPALVIKQTDGTKLSKRQSELK